MIALRCEPFLLLLGDEIILFIHFIAVVTHRRVFHKSHAFYGSPIFIYV